RRRHRGDQGLQPAGRGGLLFPAQAHGLEEGLRSAPPAPLRRRRLGHVSPRIDDMAAAGFSAGSGAYDRGRPSYPQEAVDLLADGFAGAVTVAQAFHWFDPEAALPEIARVLEPGGGLAFLWNRRDESVPWVHEMSDILRWRERYPNISGYDRVDWAEVVAPSG